MRKLALILSIIAIPLIIVATATANTQTSTLVTVHDTHPWAPATNACGFPINLSEDGTFEVTDYFDNSGTLVREIIHNHGGPFTLTATNPANNRSTTSQSETLVEITNFNPDGSIASVEDNGLISNFTAPGHGTILHGTGRLVFDGDGNLIFEAGPHAFRDQNTEAFCNYMAGH